MASLLNAFKIILPKRKSDKGTAYTSTFNPTRADQPLAAPGYREHLRDLPSARLSMSSLQLLDEMFIADPDVSAAVNAFLTVANTEPTTLVVDQDGNIDRDGHKLLDQVIAQLTSRSDYSTGFRFQPTIRTIAENLRFMILKRGACATELVFDKTLVPYEVRHVDMSTIQWKEPSPGQYYPIQRPPGANSDIDLNIPTFFVAYWRRDPTRIYSYPPFIAAINTIASRQQVINDLYRIMQHTGYPRHNITIVEEILRKNAPVNIQQNEAEMRSWMRARITEIASTFNSLRADQAFAHLDSVEIDVLNPGGPSRTMDVSAVIDVLNAQNQAALKVVSAVIGRGEKGQNLASTEVRVFARNAEELNEPVSEILSQMFTLAIRLQGSQSRVSIRFKPVELRPELELEPQKTVKQTRLLELLSHGLITDDEYHLQMHGRIRPDEIPEKSGTGFYGGNAEVNTDEISPNSDPLGRSITPDGQRESRSKRNQK